MTHTHKSTRAAAKVSDVGAAALKVRPAMPSDRTALEFFFDAVLRKDYFIRRGQLAEMVAGRYHRIWVAEIESVLVGLAVLTRGTRLVNALVHPAYRGVGIGRALIDASGATEVRAKLDMSTGDPRGFYETIGFQTTGRRNAKGNIEIWERRATAAAAGRTTAEDRA